MVVAPEVSNFLLQKPDDGGVEASMEDRVLGPLLCDCFAGLFVQEPVHHHLELPLKAWLQVPGLRWLLPGLLLAELRLWPYFALE